MAATRQQREFVDASFDQRQSLRAPPGLEALLERPGLVDPVERLTPHEADRSSASGVGGSFAVLVLPHPALEIDGAADVERPVRALEEIDPTHRTSMKEWGAARRREHRGCGELPVVS